MSSALSLRRGEAVRVGRAVAPVRLLLVDPVRVIALHGRAAGAGHGAVTQQAWGRDVFDRNIHAWQRIIFSFHKLHVS